MTTTSPIISIIIPTYNRAKIIGKTLETIMNQTYQNWECIIIDDQSDDNTFEVIKEFSKKDSRIKYFKRPESLTKGPSSCRNYGFLMSKGDLIQWFDSDDLYNKEALENYVLKFNSLTDAVVAKLEIIDLKSGKKLKENCIFSNNLIEDYFTGKVSFYVCGPMWKRDFLEKQQLLFDASIRNLDDWDFNLRMLYKNPKIEYIDKPLIQYVFHENSLSQEIKKINFLEIKSEIDARTKHLSLIKNFKSVNLRRLHIFIMNRSKFFFREALIQNHPKKMYFFQKLVRQQIRLLDLYGFIKTCFGFLVFTIFKKGYKLLK